ncbi:MAG: MBL fold metallo-hydrolase [Acidimicrobiaceae bacterium]|nr:MBL fold metallo-hydrolase [Acidimicrobiaceae bacterium]MYE08468.1 MBL fold metallo-hydrolase [Acidimicrobiaceae bacterium]MYI36597.1 MBL fold metallo-hydrolase [Acidimicrobiaceae bacterium]
MAESLLERSARFIDGSVYEGPESVNPLDASFHEIADGVGIVCGFSHIWTLDTGEGLAVVDTSQPDFASAALEHLRRWRDVPVDTIVYTHGHVDHVSGASVFRDDAAARRHRSPRVVAHDAVARRFSRYELTRGYNECINARQFGRRYRAGFLDFDWVRPQVTYSDGLELEVGQTRMQLIHEKGETDDHTIAWVPQQGVLFTGDLVIWAFPNAGNPQKAQRYPLEWAAALRRMIDLRPSLLAPAHGLPVAGTERIARVLDDTATALEGLVRDTLEMMNSGARLDEIVHTVRVPTDLLERPYLRPSYDEPEFVVRNIWRLYGGWHDANPARLKPPPDHAVAAEVAALAGGAGALARRATELCDAGELRLACQLVEWAAQAAPADEEVHAARAEVYRTRRDSEQSLMARNLFRDAYYSSKARVQPEQAPD